MKLLPAGFIALFAGSKHATLPREHSNYNFEMVGPAPKFVSDVASQLYIVFCHDINFEDCISGYVAPGLCYAPPPFGVMSVQPGQEISGASLYKGADCSPDDPVLSNVAYPGIPDLQDYGFANDVQSFIAY